MMVDSGRLVMTIVLAHLKKRHGLEEQAPPPLAENLIRAGLQFPWWIFRGRSESLQCQVAIGRNCTYRRRTQKVCWARRREMPLAVQDCHSVSSEELE